MIEEKELLVPPPLDGERLDRALAELLGRSRGWARRVIDLGGVYLDGQRLRLQSRAVVAGQQLTVCWAEPPDADPPPLAPTALLLQARGWVAVDKPAGVHAQAARHRVLGTLPDLVARLLNTRHLPEPVHRLDRETSGVMILALDRGSTVRLTRAWREGEVRKRYLAVVAAPPQPASGELTFALARDPAHPGAMRALSGRGGGQAAVTRYETLAVAGGRALLQLEPLTGRTHQLRVHCSAAGFPILGDPRYAPLEVVGAAPRLALHAERLVLPARYGRGGKPLELIAPLPEDFRQLLARLGFGQAVAREGEGRAEVEAEHENE